MSNTKPLRIRTRRAQLLPTSSANERPRFLEPFDRTVEATSLILGSRQDNKPRPWLSDADVRRLRRVVAVCDHEMDDRCAGIVKRIFARRIDGTWRDLGAVWGIDLSEDNRAAITAIVNQYFDVVIFEVNSSPMAYARETLDKLEETAKEFSGALAGLYEGIDERAKRDAGWHVEGLIAEHLRDLRNPMTSACSLVPLANYIDGVVHACKKARRDLEGQPEGGGLKDGQSWRWLIGRLAEWAKEQGYPATVSKGRQKSKSDSPPSKFVAFVDKLQKLFPPKCRKHTHSIDALATAMSTARREYAKRNAGA